MKIFSARKLAEVLEDPRIRLSGVAKVAKISTATIHAILNETRKPTANTLAAIAYALDKPIEYFYEEEEDVVLEQQKLALPLTKGKSKKRVSNA